MLVNNLKEIYPNWKSLFIYNSPYLQYKIGKFTINSKTKLLVMNVNTLDIMEYYFDDVSERIIDLNVALQQRLQTSEDLSGLYGIQGYTIINLKTGKPRTINLCLRKQYPEIALTIKGKSYNTKIHRIIASVFIPNIDNTYTIVNHKDSNTTNFSKENLEWCDPSYNNSSENRNILNTRGDKTIYKQIDTKGNVLNTFNSTQEVKEFYPSYRKCLNNNKFINGFTFKSYSTNVLEYLNRHPIQEDVWYKHPTITSHLVEANKCGILRINGKLKLGNLDEKAFTYRIEINNKAYLVHRLVYECISGKPIPEGKVIDHLIPVTSIETINNEFSNLRVCTQKENMNNPNTLIKRRY